MKRIVSKNKIIIVCLFILVVFTRLYAAYNLPDLYGDEKDIIAQASSINEFGKSIEGNVYPFYFIIGSGLGTYLFVYPLCAICRLVGYSMQDIRVCLQLITIIAIANIAIGVKVYSKNIKLGMYTFFVGLMLPWGFVQANRIWDPVMVPLYFSIFFLFYCIYLGHRFENNLLSEGCLVISEAALVLLAIVYPPCRIPAVALWIFSVAYIYRQQKLKIRTFVAIIIICMVLALPMVYNMIFNSTIFNERAEKMFIFAIDNKAYATFSYLKNFLKNFDPTYLFISGDVIDRHSLPILGVLGTVSIVPMVTQIRKSKYDFIEILAWYCILWSTLSVALINDTQPHTLRNCLCWPAFSILISYGWYSYFKGIQTWKKVLWSSLAIAQYILVFAAYIAYYKGDLLFVLKP